MQGVGERGVWPCASFRCEERVAHASRADGGEEGGFGGGGHRTRLYPHMVQGLSSASRGRCTVWECAMCGVWVPLLHVVGRGGDEGVLVGVQPDRTHRLLVVGEHGGGAAGDEVPQPDRRVHRARDDLR